MHCKHETLDMRLRADQMCWQSFGPARGQEIRTSQQSSAHSKRQKAHLSSLKHMSGVAFTSHHQGRHNELHSVSKGAACSHWHHAWGFVSKSQRSAFYEKVLADHIMLFPFGSQGFCAMLRFVMIEVGANGQKASKAKSRSKRAGA